MKASAEWEGAYRSRLTDERGHTITVDLTREEGGEDAGTSSLELAVLSLAGCISTIFLLVAEKRRLPVHAVRVDLEAQRPRGARTITTVSGTARIETTGPAEEVATALRLTVRTCPVGALFEQAGVAVTVEPVIVPPTPATRDENPE